MTSITKSIKLPKCKEIIDTILSDLLGDDYTVEMQEMSYNLFDQAAEAEKPAKAVVKKAVVTTSEEPKKARKLSGYNVFCKNFVLPEVPVGTKAPNKLTAAAAAWGELTAEEKAEWTAEAATSGDSSTDEDKAVKVSPKKTAAVKPTTVTKAKASPTKGDKVLFKDFYEEYKINHPEESGQARLDKARSLHKTLSEKAPMALPSIATTDPDHEEFYDPEPVKPVVSAKPAVKKSPVLTPAVVPSAVVPSVPTVQAPAGQHPGFVPFKQSFFNNNKAVPLAQRSKLLAVEWGKMTPEEQDSWIQTD
jgi:hypothetical protein